MLSENPNKNINYDNSQLKTCYLAGGCFWGMEAFMSRLKGVASTTVGYANGYTEDPTYEAVCKDDTGFAETLHIHYDETIISLKTLLTYFFDIIDPTSVNLQGGDTGSQYRTGIYYTDEADRDTAKQFLSEQQKKYSSPIAVEVLPLSNFYKAEEYHQQYLEKNPGGYCHIDMSKLPRVENTNFH